MNKHMRELLAQIQAKTAEAKAAEDVTKASELMDEVEKLQAEFEVEKKIYEAEKMAGAQSAIAPVVDHAQVGDKKVEMTSIEKFGHDAKLGFRVNKTMNEGTAADGGYTVPEDIVTKIESYRDAKFSLLNLVKKVKVNTNAGARTFKKRAQQTGFSQVGEGAAIGAKATPQFERIEYTIKKYAGYYPVTNEVLADSDNNLGQVLIEWIGDESRVTANNLIIDKLETLTSTAITSLDDIKSTINVTLGAKYAGLVKIVTNDDGLQWFDTLKDENGRYLLAPMPGDTMAMGLQVGPRMVPIEVIGNEALPTDATNHKIPVYIGAFEEGIVYWDRAQRNIKISDVAAIGDLNAFEDDLTLYRAIEREDVTFRDEDAIVAHYITVAAG